MIFPGAFRSNITLQSLNLDGIKLKWPKEDLVFMKHTTSLCRLSLAGSFPKKNLESISVFNFVKIRTLDELVLSGNGVLSIMGIADSFPNITSLDLSGNRIF